MTRLYLRWRYPGHNACMECQVRLPAYPDVRLIDVSTDIPCRTTGHIYGINMANDQNGKAKVWIEPPLCGAGVLYSVRSDLAELSKLVAKMSHSDHEAFLGELSMLVLAGGEP